MLYEVITVAREAKAKSVTRASVCMEKASRLQKPLIIAIGNAPTALIKLDELIESGKINPIVLMEFGEIPAEISNAEIKEGTKALYCLISVGDELSKASTKAFAEGDYVSGLMLDVMADDILFQIGGLIQNDVISIS